MLTIGLLYWGQLYGDYFRIDKGFGICWREGFCGLIAPDLVKNEMMVQNSLQEEYVHCL
jgi:hypothetical protein